MKKVALVYDRINKFGGAERVLLALHEIFPEAPLYTSVYDKKAAPWADVFKVKTSFLQNFPLPKNAHEMYPYLMGFAFESLNFDEYDLVISVCHEFSKAIITKPHTVHICYCLNPVGYIWDSYKDYFFTKPYWFKVLTLPLVKYLRWYDKIVSQRPDIYISISKTIQERVKRIYKRDSDVIYPPVDSQGETLRVSRVSPYYLIVSRLVPQKRIDIAIEAFNRLGLPLKIVGTGKEDNRLKDAAKNNIEFLGYLQEEEVKKYYLNCKAVVIPGEEDFNIVAVEAQSFGKPVIAFKKGGVRETVRPGRTGWFFDDLTADDLIATIEKSQKEVIKWQECKENAKKFSKERFKKEFLNYVRSFKKDN